MFRFPITPSSFGIGPYRVLMPEKPEKLESIDTIAIEPKKFRTIPTTASQYKTRTGTRKRKFRAHRNRINKISAASRRKNWRMAS